jgi:drug/metabolite transporter (DMT)-like permease
VLARAAALAGVNGPSIVVYRVLLMLAVVGAACALARRPLAMARADRPRIGLFGLSTAVLGLCYVSSVAYVPVAVAAAIFYAYPLLIALASPWVDGTRLTLRLAAVVAAALVGVILVVGPALDGLDWRGVALALTAALACTVQFFAAAKSPESDPLATVFWVHAIVLPAALLAGALTGRIEGPAIFALAPLVVFAAIAGYIMGFGLQVAALSRIPPTAAGIIYCLEPVVSAGVSVFALREPLGGVQIAGGLLVLAAILTNILLERSRVTSP